MEKDFWLEKWQQGQIGFHQNRVMPLLQKYWHLTKLKQTDKVLVPLAGKSLDVAWLAEQGHEVWAIELSEIAVEQFFAEHKLQAQITDHGNYKTYSSGNINYICGDIFELEASFFNDFMGCYDRAALIALSTDLRKKYVEYVYGNLPVNCNILLLTIDYKQAEMQGPPFAIGNELIDELFKSNFAIDLADRRDILANEPKFKERGLTSMFTNVYLLNKN